MRNDASGLPGRDCRRHPMLAGEYQFSVVEGCRAEMVSHEPIQAVLVRIRSSAAAVEPRIQHMKHVGRRCVQRHALLPCQLCQEPPDLAAGLSRRGLQGQRRSQQPPVGRCAERQRGPSQAGRQTTCYGAGGKDFIDNEHAKGRSARGQVCVLCTDPVERRVEFARIDPVHQDGARWIATSMSSVDVYPRFMCHHWLTAGAWGVHRIYLSTV